jgi:hypothetical protein
MTNNDKNKEAQYLSFGEVAVGGLSYTQARIRAWAEADSLPEVHNSFLGHLQHVVEVINPVSWSVLPYRNYLGDRADFYLNVSLRTPIGQFFQVYVHKDALRSKVPIDCCLLFNEDPSFLAKSAGLWELPYYLQGVPSEGVVNVLRNGYVQDTIPGGVDAIVDTLNILLDADCFLYYVPSPNAYSRKPMEYYGYRSIPGIRPHCPGVWIP